MSNPSWGWGWSHPEGPPGPKRALKSCKQTNKRANLCCRRPAVLPGGLELLFPAQRPASPGNLNFRAFSEKVKASSLHETRWEIFMLGWWVKLLRVVKRRWTFSSLGRQGRPGVTHVPLWVRLLPAALLGGPAPPPGWVFPCGICPTRAACGPAATGGFPGCRHPPNWRGSCFPPSAALFPVGCLVAGHHTAGTQSWRCLLPLPPEAGGGLYLPAAQLLVAKPSQGSTVPLPWGFSWIYPTEIPLVPP